ncbi:Vgb family protein [Pedococcus sp. P5_B7]
MRLRTRPREAVWVAVVVATCLTGAGCAAEGVTPASLVRTGSTSATPPVTPGWPPVTDLLRSGGTALPVYDADWVQVIGDHAWTALGSGVVQQLDGATGKERTGVKVAGGTCTAMDGGPEALWVGICTSPSRLLRINPASGQVVARIPLPGFVIAEEGSVASGEGAVWVVGNAPDRQLWRIDPKTNRVVSRTHVPETVVAARAGLGGLWLTDPVLGVLLRLDPRTQKTVATVKVGAGARFFAAGEGAVWVQNNGDGTVSRVDPATNDVTATITVDSGPVQGGDLAVGGGFVWARVSDALVAKIDPATDTVVARYGPAGGSGSVAADDAAVWISAHDIDVVYRLPLR